MKKQLIIPAKKKVYQPAIIEKSTAGTPSIEIHQRDIWIKINNPSAELSQGVFNALRNHKIEEAIKEIKELPYYSEDNECLVKDKKMEVIRDDFKEHIKYIEETKNTYGQALWIKNPCIPFHYDFRWIAGNEQLMSHLGKKTRFIDIFNYLSDKVSAEGEDLFPRRYTRTGKEWPYAIIKVNKAFYDEMALKLSLREKSITRISIEKYLRAFCNLGILIQLTRGGGRTGKDSLYAIGYWTPYEGIYRIRYLLKKSEPGLDRLLSFSVV